MSDDPRYPQPLHEDDPDAEVVMPDGRVVRNLSVEEYDAELRAAMVDAEPCQPIPADVMAHIEAEADRIAAERGYDQGGDDQ